MLRSTLFLVCIPTFLILAADPAIAGPPVSPNWTWMSGSTMCNRDPDYGIPGVPSPSNTPGSRDGAAMWAGEKETLWLFGGMQKDEWYKNDMWLFDITAGIWLCVEGSSLPNQTGEYGTMFVEGAKTTPSARTDAAYWTDKSGRLWLFGGYGYDAAGVLGNLNDLWVFNPGNQNWTWMGGSKYRNFPGVYGDQGKPSTLNVPSARYSCATWLDLGGRLWLFGGFGSSEGGISSYLNDLWCYNITARTWEWVHGSPDPNPMATWGTLGVEAPRNDPSARENAVAWCDRQGCLWLYGGLFNHVTTGPVLWSDLWRFNPVSGQWAWMGGDGQYNRYASYGVGGIDHPDNHPGGRAAGAGYVAADGTFWLFGGFRIQVSPPALYLFNDVWRYNPANRGWVWMKGSVNPDLQGVYGTMRVGHEYNSPGARSRGAFMSDSAGRMWLYGGNGFDETLGGAKGNLGDLWLWGVTSFVIPTNASAAKPTAWTRYR